MQKLGDAPVACRVFRVLRPPVCLCLLPPRLLTLGACGMHDHGRCSIADPKPFLFYAETVSTILALPVALAVAVVAWPQAASNRFPKFQDYPASSIFTGTPASPKLVRPADRLFRTQIRDGAAKRPNFAGHYSIVEWGCGSSCVSIAIVDAKDGEVYAAPFRDLGYGSVLIYADVSEEHYEPLDHKLNSRLLVVRGCPEDRDCASYFYVWTGSTFKLIDKGTAVPPPH